MNRARIILVVLMICTSNALAANVITWGTPLQTAVTYCPENDAEQLVVRAYYQDENGPILGASSRAILWDNGGSPYELNFCPSGDYHAVEALGVEEGSGWYRFTIEAGAGIDTSRPLSVMLRVTFNDSDWKEATMKIASPDLTGDLQVNLSDTVRFAELKGAGYDSRCDYDHNNVLDLTDTIIFVQHSSHACE